MKTNSSERSVQPNYWSLDSSEDENQSILGCYVLQSINPLKPELNPICYLLALLGAHHYLHVSRIRVKLLTFRRLMSYIWSTHS